MPLPTDADLSQLRARAKELRRAARYRDLHRWFAVELNNTLWDALDGYAPPEPLADPERVLYQAYAACFHWLHAGTVVNHGRGEYGIAWAALAAGRFELAAHHARRYAELIEASPAAFADWDRAFCAEVLARVAAARGAVDAAEHRAAAVRLAEAVAEDQDRAIVLDRLTREPWFG